MNSLSVTGITVSIKVGDMDYGKGSERFISLRSEAEEGSSPELSYDDVIEQALLLCGQAWVAAQASRYAEGVIGATDLKEALSKQKTRTDKVLNFLRGENEPTAE